MPAKEMIEKRMTADELDRASKIIAGDAEVRKTFAKLSEAIDTHLGASFFSAQRNKENKLKIVKLFESLPKELQELVSLPPNAIETLFRGVKGRHQVDENNIMRLGPNFPKADPEVEGWAEGGFVYSFTGEAQKAENFAGGTTYKGASGYVINASDIESFKGIINPYRILIIANNYRKNPLPNQPAMESHVRRSLSHDLLAENEAIVYGIKFKPDAFKDKKKQG